MRLGVYSDLRYRADRDGVSTHQAFVSFVAQLPPRVAELVIFGRVDPVPGRSYYALPQGVRFVALPHYARVTAIGGQLRAARGTVEIFVRELARLDAVWIFGPHPISLVLAIAARRHDTPLILGVRQDYPRYIAGRLPSRKWVWAVAAAHVLERTFRGLARTAPTVAVGDELARRYAGGAAPVLSTGFSLVRAADIVDPDSAPTRALSDEVRILSVGRLDPEKNPLLLADVLHALRQGGGRWRLTVAGEGPLAAELRRRVDALGLAAAVEFAGYVPQGEQLRALYRAHDVFLHVSFTEGFPQVLFEAQAAGLPVVATAVGGVPGAVAPSRSAVLIPPSSAAAAADAVRRVATDPELRRRLIGSGLDNVRANTTEAQLDRISAFLAASLPAGKLPDRGTQPA
jgi:glycosyltransferase involved in cell wall biosynthesis